MTMKLCEGQVNKEMVTSLVLDNSTEKEMHQNVHCMSMCNSNGNGPGKTIVLPEWSCKKFSDTIVHYYDAPDEHTKCPKKSEVGKNFYKVLYFSK